MSLITNSHVHRNTGGGRAVIDQVGSDAGQLVVHMGKDKMRSLPHITHTSKCQQNDNEGQDTKMDRRDFLYALAVGQGKTHTGTEKTE